MGDVNVRRGAEQHCSDASERRCLDRYAACLRRLAAFAVTAITAAWSVPLAEAQGSGSAASQQKDFWDKLDAASGIAAGVLVAAIGAFATYVYNRRQQQATAADAARQLAAEDARAERELAVLRVQTIQSFFPHLKSDDDRDREAALLAIDALGDHELANQLAVSYGGKAAVGALSRIATTAPEEAADRATDSLATIVDALRGSVVRVGTEQAFGTGFIVSQDGVVATANYVLDIEGDLLVRFPNGEEHPASVLYRGPSKSDVGLLRIPGDRLPSLRLSKEPPIVGDAIVTLGFPGSGSDPVSVGVITDFLPPHDEFPGEVLARIRTEPGFSGAPYVLSSGEVVAVHGGVTVNPDGTRTAIGIWAAAFASALDLTDFEGNRFPVAQRVAEHMQRLGEPRTEKDVERQQ